MKRSKLRIVAVIMAVVMLFTFVPLCFYAAEADDETPASDVSKSPDFIKDCKTGDTINFGQYPQSKVDDEKLIAELEKENKSWVSYNYYSGDGVMTGGGMAPSDYMKYSDFEYESQLYRAVQFTKFRPQYTFESNDSQDVLTFQDDNGYECSKTYYFKYEPLSWRVLDPAAGLVMCSKVIDAQPFNDFFVYAKDETGEGSDICWSNDEHTVRADDYTKSSVRYWLENSFLSEAFSVLELSKIEETAINNKKYGSEEAYEQSEDKAFLLSYDDVTNEAYGFAGSGSEEDLNRKLTATDYAKIQGVMTEADVESTIWTLRTSHENGMASAVNSSGNADSGVNIYSATGGIVPAMVINPEKSITRAEKGDLDLDGKVNSGDALIMLKHAVGLEEIKEDLKLSADINNDGKINSADALFVLRYSVGMIGGFGYFPNI